jgi:hypothetical protein
LKQLAEALAVLPALLNELLEVEDLAAELGLQLQ